MTFVFMCLGAQPLIVRAFPRVWSRDSASVHRSHVESASLAFPSRRGLARLVFPCRHATPLCTTPRAIAVKSSRLTRPSTTIPPSSSSWLTLRGWVSPWRFGLNEGPIVLMIENYLSELTWNTVRTNPDIVTGLRRAGFRGGRVGAKLASNAVNRLGMPSS